MAEAFADHGHGDSGGEHEAGLTVAEVVEPDWSQPGGVGEFAEAFGHGFGVQGRAVGFGEDVTTVDPRFGPQRALLLLAEPMAEQCSDGCLVEVYDAVLAAGGLDWADERSVSELDDLLPDRQPGTFDIDVLPPEPEQLASAQPGERRDFVQGAERVAGGVVEELPELGGLPRTHGRSGCLG